MGGAWSTHRRDKDAHKIVVANLKVKYHLGANHRQGNNTKMYLNKTGFESAGWIHLAQNRDQCQTLVNTAVNFMNTA